MDIYKYYLVVDGIVHYVGLTNNPKARKSAHKREKPPHQFILAEKYSESQTASAAEREDIEKYNTFLDKTLWNKDPGGNYADASGFSRKGIGGRKKGSTPWNKGVSDERTKRNAELTAQTRKNNDSYKNCGKTLPKLYGEKNHMKQPEHRKRMSDLASRRYKIIKEDGSWTWGYRPL